MEAPRMAPCPFCRKTWICVNLPKRDEFLFSTVSALPNASSRGLVMTSSEPSSIDDLVVEATSLLGFASLVTNARWRSTSLHVSVFPEPDGPETMIACDRRENGD